MWVWSIHSFADFTLSLTGFQGLDGCITTLVCMSSPQWVVLHNTKLHITLINPIIFQGSLYTGKLNVMKQLSGTKANYHRKLLPVKAR